MHHVELTEQAYEQAKRRAIEAGFKGVEEFF
jgi:2,4-dienoyl-CoA reductase-like NADH-dependent reductase (Old Yellow Enzyme family)